jgi:hypothetical protein
LRKPSMARDPMKFMHWFLNYALEGI